MAKNTSYIRQSKVLISRYFKLICNKLSKKIVELYTISARGVF